MPLPYMPPVVQPAAENPGSAVPSYVEDQLGAFRLLLFFPLMMLVVVVWQLVRRFWEPLSAIFISLTEMLNIRRPFSYKRFENAPSIPELNLVDMPPYLSLIHI